MCPELSNRLRSEGIDCNIDQYETSPPEGWPRWMINQIEEADFVLVVCTEKYEKRFKGKDESGKGLGAKWEGTILTQELYYSEANRKCIPIVFSFEDCRYIPTALKSVTYYKLNIEDDYESTYDELYARLTNQNFVIKPSLGKLRQVKPKNSSLAVSMQDKKVESAENKQKPVIGKLINIITGTEDNSLDNKKPYADLIKELQTLNGFKLFQEIDLLKMTLNAFYGNFVQLNNLIDIFENNPEIWYLQNKQKHDALCLDIIRSFHNYVSSSSSRIDHMRNFKRKLDNQNVDIFFENEVKKLTDIEIVVFMKDLRNYIQHNELPFTKVTLTIKSIPETNLNSWEPKLLLDRHKLLTWDGWTLKPKKYLKNLNEDINLKLCCKEYNEHIITFDNNFFEMLKDEYKSDIDEYQNFNEKINKLYPK